MATSNSPRQAPVARTDLPLDAPMSSDPARWVSEHGDALFRYAMSRVRNRDLAEELVQETLFAALRAKESYSGRSSQRTWLIAILRRKIIDHFRAAQARQVENVEEAGGAKGEPWFDDRGHWKVRVRRWAGDPVDLLTDREFSRTMNDCIASLPAGLVEAFTLRELEGVTTKDVCKVLGLSPSNLWTRLHRARMLLRRCLDEKWFSKGG